MDLPRSYTPFVGRARELADIERALSQSRLVTLTGPGGCGKTRLALEYARLLSNEPARQHYAEGLTWCDLATLADPAFVADRLAATLELSDHPGQPAADLIAGALQSQERLIILDNCEHLMAGCVPLASRLLADCPRIKILATSIQPLGLAAEQLYSVPPLALPPAAGLDVQTPAELEHFEAIGLFLQRAREAFPSFELTPHNSAAIITICRRLDGLPLAIELAAARVKMLAPAQIVQRLDDAFALLTRGRSEALPKHQTLRATLDWTYRLLSQPEQALLRRLSIFAGSFDVSMVEAVCGDAGLAAPLDALTDLVERSFVSIWQHEPATVRYGLLETVRQYAREQLQAAAEQATVAERLLDWCIELLEHMQPELEGAAQAAAFGRLELDHDNLSAALQWALDGGRFESGLRLAGALERFWLIQAHPSEGRAWLSRLLAQAGRPVDPAVRARALSVAGLLADRQSEWVQAEAYLQECLHIWQGLNDATGIALALNKLGDVMARRGQEAAAIQAFEDSLRLRRALGDDRGVASALISLGAAIMEQGDYARATRLNEEALELCRRLGDQWMIAVVLNNLGAVAVSQAHWSRAQTLLLETLAIRRALGDQNGAAIALSNLAEVAAEQQNWPQAHAWAAESLGLYQLVNNRGGVSDVFIKFALAETAQGRAARAARLLGTSEALRAAIGVQLPPGGQAEHDALLARLRAELDGPTLERMWLEGRALPLADAIAYALSEPADVRPASVECYVTALGQMAVRVHGVALTDADWRYAKARELFFYLLSQPQATKEQLGLALYPEASPSQVRARLHRVLHHARRALGHNDWILFDGNAYAVNRDRPLWYDVEQFERRVRAARAALAESPRQVALAIRLLQDASPLYTGDFLPELDADWSLFRREELRRQALEALLELGHLLLAEGRPAEAIAVYQRALELDTYLEAAHRELMRGYARLGEAGRARQHYQRLCQVLRDELGTGPSPETARLNEQIGAGQAV